MHLDRRTADLALTARSPVARLNAKIGAGARQYPRTRGVLVPHSLGWLPLDPVVREPLPSPEAARLRLGRVVVAAVAKNLRHLPADVLSFRLPPPSVVLGSCPIEHRTRNVLERLVPFEVSRPWSVSRYLQAPRFGPRCLTDLLAAHEESRRPPTEDAPSLATVMAEAPRDVDRNDADLAGAPDGGGLTRALREVALRQVTAWGLSDIAQVVAQIAVLGDSPASATIAQRVLVGLPRLRWLDDRKRWFSLTGERSPLRQAIGLVFAVADRVELSELRAALAKSAPAARSAPPPVFARYLCEIADCVILEDEVSRRVSDARPQLSEDEHLLIDQLRAHGGQAPFESLCRLLPAGAERRRRLEWLIERSPLFLRTDEARVRLVGGG